MKQSTAHKIILLECIILVLLFNIGIYFYNTLYFYKTVRVESIVSCGGKNLFNTTYCLQDYVDGIYIYNITPDNETQTLGSLKARGGDCLDWTRFYERQFNNFGFNTQRIQTSINKTTGHVFLVVEDTNGYCLVDQLEAECFIYEI